jgi:hypothetical protein
VMADVVQTPVDGRLGVRAGEMGEGGTGGRGEAVESELQVGQLGRSDRSHNQRSMGSLLGWMTVTRAMSTGEKCDILVEGFNRIDRILIPPRNTFFFGSPTTKNSRFKQAWPRTILGWVMDREVFTTKVRRKI